MRFVSRWPGRYSEARQPRSKGGPVAQCHNHNESKGHCTRSRKESHRKPKHGLPKTPRPGLKRAIRQKTRPPDVRRSSTEPHHVLKNQRDTPERVTIGQELRNPRHYARSVRDQENGSTWHFRTSTSRTANHPEKAETDKPTRRQG